MTPASCHCDFSTFLSDWVELANSSSDTYADYYMCLNTYIVPYFDTVKRSILSITVNDSDTYSYEMNVVGLTSNTVIHRHANIRKCLQYAFQVGFIKSNPADWVERPQKNVFVSEYYDTQELDELFQTVKGDPIELPVILAASYGMRRSEIVGLKWDCIDFEKKTISIQHVVTDIYLDVHLVTIEKDKTKTKSSTRTLPLVKPFEDALIKLKEQQKQQQKLCGNAYNKDYLEYILRDKMENKIKPGYVSQHFRIVLTKNNLKLIRFHDLRHSCASLLYANGVDLKAIQEWLGHSTITTTANTYTHFDFSKKVQSAEAIMGNYPAQMEQKREG